MDDVTSATPATPATPGTPTLPPVLPMREPRHPFRDWIYLYNPVYLLSSVCMLASCVLLANDSVSKNVPIGKLLALVGTLVVYQACLFAIGAFLSLARGVLRDGRTLLILDAVFLSDITFVNSELLTTNLNVGIAISLVLFALSGIRINWIANRLQSPVPLHRYLLILLQLLMIVAIPAYLKHIDNGVSVTANVLYATWWIASLVVAGGLLVDHAIGRDVRVVAKGRWIQPAYLTIGWLSLVLHLAVLHYVYDVAFHSAMLSPVFIALAVLLRRMEERRILPSTLGVQGTLLVLALVFGQSTLLALPLWGDLSVSAIKLTLAAAYFAVIYMYLRKIANWMVAAGVLVAALILFGPSWRQVMAMLDALARAIRGVIPSTRLAWGIIGIVTSFLLLGLGLIISLRKPPDEHQNASAKPALPEPPSPGKDPAVTPAIVR